MDDLTKTLTKLGLTASQALVYRTLVGEKEATIQEIIEKTGENRTTIYMILARLGELGLVSKIKEAKSTFIAESPTELKTILAKKQSELKQTNIELNNILPLLNKEYIISHQKPGVVYLEGIDGLKLIYEEIIDTRQEFLILPCTESRSDTKMNELIEHNIAQQKKYNIIARTLYPEKIKNETDTTELKNNNILVRFFGDDIHHKAQILIYSTSIAITTFSGGIFTTLITNELVADTWRGYFESMWKAGSA